MVARAALAVAVIGSFLLAGCSGDAPKASLIDGLTSSAPEAMFDFDTGALEGFVRDDELVPIAEARLQLRELKTIVETATDGSFSFSMVPPGRYTLDATKLGYQAASRGVVIEAGKAIQANLELKAIPVQGPTHPRSEVLGPFQGYMQCRMSTPLSSGACGFLPQVGNTPITSLWTNDKIQFRFNLTSPDWEQFIFEARWKPSSFATNPKMTQVFSYTNRSGFHWFGDSGAKFSPIKFNFTKGEKNSGGQFPAGHPKEPNISHTLITWLTVPFANPADLQAPSPAQVAYELRFETMVTIYYSSREPEPSYTAFED